MKYLFCGLLVCFLFISNSPIAQGLPVPTTLSSGDRGWTDPALNHNKLLQQHSTEGMQKLIGPYKVNGSSYLFGEHLKADMFASEAKAYNIHISYNTYNQEVEFYSSSNPDKPLIKEPGSVDSFIIHSKTEVGLAEPIKFIYGAILATSDKSYFKEIYSGKRFSIYKRYKSDLEIVSTNYVQSELRQFELLYDYYYSDANKKEKGLKKLKTNSSNIIKEFKDIKDISPVMTNDAFTANQEEALKKAFAFLNN